MNAAGTSRIARARDGQRAVQLGEAQVVADAQAQAGAVGGRAEHRRVAGRLVVGLAVDGAVDLDVEQVDLAVGRADLAVGADVDARVAQLLLAGDALGDRAGDEVDRQLARDARAPR